MKTPSEPQVVLITGATGGLGGAVAAAFAGQEAHLALTARQEQALHRMTASLALPPDRMLLYPADITQLPAAHGLCQAVLQRFGRIDALINVAGGFRMGRVHETPEEVFDSLIDLNARTAFNLAHGVVPSMIERGRGRIIHVAARAGLAGGERIGVYAASKAALLRLSESMSAELLQHGITVNCVLPSIIDTPQNRKDMPDADFGKWVTPESLAGVIVFLASDAARDISGAAIPVYGRS